MEQDNTNVTLQDSTSEVDEHIIVITRMRVTDIATAPRRIPAGFYAIILIGDEQYRTMNKRVSLESGTIEWTDHFRLPANISTTIDFRVYASFELGPMLGRGELLRRVCISVEDLIDHSDTACPIAFLCERESSALEVHVCELSPVDLRPLVLSPPVAFGSPLERDMSHDTDLGLSYMLRYYQDREESLLDDAILQYESVVDHCPENHACRGAALSNLAMAELVSCEERGAYHDIDIPIALYRDALNLRPNGHPDHAFALINLANTLLFRFHMAGHNVDADEAKGLLETVLEICPADCDEHRSALLMVQGLAVYDADDVVSFNSTTPGSLAMPANLQISYSFDQLVDMLEESQQRDDPQVLDNVISGYHQMEAYHVEGQLYWIALQINLALALSMRFERKGRKQDLDEAIKRNQDVLLWTPAGHEYRAGLLSNLAAALTTRFRQRGDGSDLDEAVEHQRDALLLTPIGHPDRSISLNKLATALTTRFEERGDSNDLNEAVQHHRDALSLTPIGHPARSGSLNHLGIALMRRFEERGDGSDLDEAVQRHRDALSLTPIDHPNHSASLNNLGIALSTRFEEQGDGSDLDEAIQHHRDALLLTVIGHPDRSGSLNNLAGALRTRFEQRGHGSDLDEAVEHQRDALSLTPIGHPNRSMSLNNLGIALRSRFEQRGNGSDLDEAVKHHRDALPLTSIGHPQRSSSLNNLATALRIRFEQRGDGNDLNEAVEHHRDALSLTPIGHPDRSMSLNNLAIALSTRSEERGDGSDRDEAIQHHRDALSLRPIGHPNRSGSLSNLGIALRRRFEERGNGNDLNEAVEHHRDALSLTPVGHPNRSTSLNNLAGSLATRFEHHASGEDADEALQLCHVAENQTASGHPIRLSICRASASIYLALWEKTRVETHMHNAMASYKVAADVETAGLLPRLKSCLDWVECGEQRGQESTLEAYARAITLFDTHLSATASVSVRHATMKNFPASLAVDAASCALRHGEVPRALELLEQGRALLWNQMSRFRTSLDHLRARDAHAEMLVKRFQELGFQLGKQSTEEPSSVGISRATIDEEARHYRGLVDQWHEVLAEIRTLDGFSRFLLPPLFSDLQEAGCEGPVIVLIASRFSCDAIIVLHDRPPIHIFLDTTLPQLAGLANQLRKETLHSSMPDERSIKNVLRQLWDKVMVPVMSKLDEFLERGSRIWWCPTSIFTAFPLHAVGVSERDSVVGKYISSYTPSLSTLIKARKSRHPSSPAHFAAIGQALPDGPGQLLLSVDQELEEIEGLLPLTSTVFTKLAGSASTRDEAHRALRDNPWVHFSCHGTQNFKEPFKSSLSMRDGPLSLLDLMNTDLSKHEFAFLSACETAVGDLESMDEAIHLAAGLQFMGVKSVVGTLWKVMDDVAPRMVSKFYKEFCSGDEMDPRRAARALHEACVSLAREKVPLGEQIMFIHIGI